MLKVLGKSFTYYKNMSIIDELILVEQVTREIELYKLLSLG